LKLQKKLSQIRALFISKPVVAWFVVALLIRVVSTVAMWAISQRVGSGGYLAFGVRDDRTYMAISRAIVNGKTPREIGNTFPFLIAPVVYILRGSVLGVELVCALISAAAVAAWCGVVRSLGSVPLNRSVHIVGLVMTLNPMSVFLAGGVLKDGFVSLCVALIIWAAIRMRASHLSIRLAIFLIVLVLGSTALLFSLRVYVAVPLALGIVLFLASKRPRGLLLSAPIIGVWLWWSSTRDLAWFDANLVFDRMDLDSLLALRRSAYSSGGSGLGITIGNSGWPLWRGVFVSTVSAMFGPFPGQIVGLRWMILALDSVLRVAAILAAWTFRPVVVVGSVALRRFCCGVAVVVALAIGLVSNNAGANVRLRETPFALVLVAVAMTGRRRGKQESLPACGTEV
jgi:hypothetical protein